MFSPNVSQRSHCLDRLPTTEKPSEGEENSDNYERRFSQVQYNITTGWRTMNVNDDVYNKDTLGLRGRLLGYESLGKPCMITTAGKHQLKGDASGVVADAIIDKLE